MNTKTYREIFKFALVPPLSSNKFRDVFNRGTNLLMPIYSQVFSNKRVLSCNCLATNNNF